MESLKPLKIIGGLGLLCLIALLCFPEGRLNAGSAIRSMLDSSQRPSEPQGKNARFLREYKTVLNSSGSQPGTEVLNARTRVAKSALASNELALLGMASRKISLPGNKKIDDPVELTAYREFIEAAQEVSKLGQSLDPENAFWPMQLAVLSNDNLSADPFLKQASECTFYNDFFTEERAVILSGLNYAPSAYEEAMVLAAVMFPNLTYYKSVCLEHIQNKSLEQSIEQRATVAKIGKIMSTTSEVYIPTLVGRAIALQSILKPPGEGLVGQRYSLSELKSAALKKGIDTDVALKGATAIYQDSQPISFPEIEGWRIVERFGPSLLTLPYMVFVIFLLSPLVILYCQKIADRPWIKSIRYLAILPLSLCFVNDANSAGFHLGTTAIILAVSIPVALITFTEKFIPVVHITTVALAFNTFYRGENFDNLAIETAAIAVLTLAAWAKNRAPEKSASKWASHILLLLAIVAIGMWALKQFGSGVLPAPTYANLGFVLLSFLAIADVDRMQARRQAMVLASIGLAAFVATAIASLQITNLIRRAIPEEIAFVKTQNSRYQSFFDNTDRATNLSDPSVKPIR